MQRMRTVLAVALGALARWGIGAWFGHRFPSFRWGTMVINVSGSFILGVLFAVLVERNIGFSVVLGLLAVWLGVVAGRAVA